MMVVRHCETNVAVDHHKRIVKFIISSVSYEYVNLLYSLFIEEVRR